MTASEMSEYDRVLSELKRELTSFTQGRVAVDEDTELVGHLKLDSLQIMNLLLFIEDRYDISIPVSILPDVRTVKDLAMKIEALASRG